MHLVMPLHCPLCERTLDVVARCPDCDVAPVDAEGTVAPVEPRDPHWRAAGYAVAAVSAAVVVGFVALHAAVPWLTPLAGASVFGGVALATRLARRPQRDRRDEATDRAFAAAPVSISSAIARRGGMVAVSGALIEVPGDRSIGCAPRFAVTDGTGVALVDDESLLLWATDGAGPRERTAEVHAGSRVRVVGRARVATSEETRLVWHGDAIGYRETPTVLAFDGDATHRTVAFVVP